LEPWRRGTRGAREGGDDVISDGSHAHDAQDSQPRPGGGGTGGHSLPRWGPRGSGQREHELASSRSWVMRDGASERREEGRHGSATVCTVRHSRSHSLYSRHRRRRRDEQNGGGDNDGASPPLPPPATLPAARHHSSVHPQHQLRPIHHYQHSRRSSHARRGN
jgi:hypothetical protein